MANDNQQASYYVVRITRSYPDEFYMPPSVQYCGREFLDPDWVAREGFRPCPLVGADETDKAIKAWKAHNAASGVGQYGKLDIEPIPLERAPAAIRERYLRALAKAAWAGRA